VDAIRVTAAGDSVLSHRVATVVVGRLRDGAHDGPAGQIGSLTEREREVLRLLVHGKSNAEIATELFVSPPTVKNHISSILGKLGADNRIQAAVEAVRRRWV
jgi:two-component system, NarL family, response regulator LiaR